MPTPPAETLRADEFTTFMRAWQDSVFSTAVRLTGDEAQAQDLAQEVFLRAYEHFAELRASPTAGGWLRTVTRHLTLNYLTRRRRRWRLFSELAAPEQDGDEAGEALALQAGGAGPVDEPLDELGQEQRRHLIEEALQRLPDHQRVPLVLFHFEELPYGEIAQLLNVSLAKIKTDLFRARRALLTQLRARGLALETLS